MISPVPSMPILMAPTSEVARHGPHLRQHEFRRHHHDVVDALGVLRGERGDGARAVDAERGEGLEVGLDAGAAG